MKSNEFIMTHSDMLDRMGRNMKNPDKYPLTDQDEEVLERWNYADNLLRRLVPNASIIKMMERKYGKAKATHYRDIQNARLFFGSMAMEEKEYEKIVQQHLIDKAIRRCFQYDELKALAPLLKLRAELFGFDKDSQSDMLPEYIGNNTFVIQLPNQLEGDTPKTITIDSVEEINPEDKSAVLEMSDLTRLPPEQVKELLTRNDERDKQ